MTDVPAGYVRQDEHRALCAPLFALVAMLIQTKHPGVICWKYRIATVEGSFLCGIDTPVGGATYHLPAYFWELLDLPEEAGHRADAFPHSLPDRLLEIIDWLQAERLLNQQRRLRRRVHKEVA